MTIRRENSDIGMPITFNLSSSDPSEVVTPSSVTIPAGEAEVIVPLDIVDDTLLDGNQSVSITVSGGAYEASSLQLLVQDSDE